MIHSVTPLRRPSDSTLNGVSSRIDNLLVADLQTEAEKHLSTNPNDTERMLVVCERKGMKYAAPYTSLVSGKWTMMGGNFIHTSNSSFSDIYPGPLPVYDRIESSEN